MNTSIWGPSVWQAIHYISFGYPEKPDDIEQKQYKKFYESLGDVLPCSLCRNSYNNFIKVLPIDNYLDTRERLGFWVYLIHTMVNYKLNQQDPTLGIKNPSFDIVKRKYDK